MTGINSEKTEAKTIFAPGCALILYKKELAVKLHSALQEKLGNIEWLDICCLNRPQFPPGARLINTCPGCDRRYRANYPELHNISLWEILAEESFLPLPDYAGREMSITDACPTRQNSNVHTAVRTLLQRMNITLVEPEHTRANSRCCGDSSWGILPTEQVKENMRKRAEEMPIEDVVVYCVSCLKSIFIGGKKSRYLVDLLFGEETLPGTLEPDAWHAELKAFQDTH